MVYKALMKSLQIRFILRHRTLYNSLCEQYDRGMDPLIEVQNLTKRYGATIAVDHLTMTIEDHHIYGFLGPNGAGKTTTLHMITGCLAADSGNVKIDGYDILRAPLQAKSRIGYLPEQPPLYDDMTPEEFLRFVGEAKGLRGKKLRTAVDSVMERTSIADMRRRLIRNLSKGYRQRVGIAQAILGDPATVILDEPTVGLDPLQVTEMRTLIRELAQSHTVVFSSHILSEVSALCDRVLILAQGHLLAEDAPEHLSAHMPGLHRLIVTVRGEPDAAVSRLRQLPDTTVVILSSTGTETQIQLESASDRRESVSAALAAAGIPLLGMTLETATLEDVFLDLTRSETSEDFKEEV